MSTHPMRFDPLVGIARFEPLRPKRPDGKWARGLATT